MKWYIKNIRLINFMGYRDITYEFMIGDKIKPIYLFYAPNGSGKSSLLNAINLVYASPRLTSRDNSLLFRKLVFNQDYDSVYHGIKEGVENNNMRVEALLYNSDTGETGKVVLDNNGVVETCLDSDRYCYFIDADHPINLQKFQLNKDRADLFLELAESIYNFKCEFPEQNNELRSALWQNLLDKEELNFHNDFIINKYGVRVHFKAFSGGEKKLATMLSSLCDSNYIDDCNLIIIDSFEKEIYYKRQSRVIDKMVKTFFDKQLFIVTHSETLIKHVKDTYGDICLYDVEEYKKKDLGIDKYDN